MKPKNINRQAEKRSAVRSVVLSTLFQVLTAGMLLYARTLIQTDWLRSLALILALGDLITIPFSFAALWQRVREIERGELDEARKY